MDIDPRNRPLVMKLGITEGMEALLVNPPRDYLKLLEPMPGNVKFLSKPKNNLKFIQLFVKTNKELFDQFPPLKTFLDKEGMIWICWPKRSSGLLTDINENKLRDYLLEEGLVDVKVVYINNFWTALKFVYRLKNR